MPPHDVAKPRGEAEGTGPPRGKYGKFATPKESEQSEREVCLLHDQRHWPLQNQARGSRNKFSCIKSLCTRENACEALVGRVYERHLPVSYGTRPRRLCDDAPRAPELNDAGRVRPAPHKGRASLHSGSNSFGPQILASPPTMPKRRADWPAWHSIRDADECARLYNRRRCNRWETVFRECGSRNRLC